MPALEPLYAADFCGVSLLVQVPAPVDLTAPGEEDDDPAAGPAGELHAQPDPLATPERPREAAAAGQVVGVAMAIVAVHGQAGAVPAREAERRVRQRGEADGQRGLVGAAVAADLDLVVDDSRLSGVGAGLRRLLLAARAVQRRVGEHSGVGAATVGGAQFPVALAEPAEQAAEVGRLHKARVVGLMGGGRRRVQRQRR